MMTKIRKFRRVTMTVEDFSKISSTIDTYPVHQRPSVETVSDKRTNDSKAQKIIESIMNGIDIGQLTLNEFGENNPCHSKKGYQYESIDGGHRKRSIIAFLNNKFRCNGLYFSQWLKNEMTDLVESFMNYELSMVIYEDLNPIEVGEIFRKCNDSTPVNHQEYLNSYMMPIANAVRCAVRLIPDHERTRKIHKFLASTTNEETNDVTFDCLGFNNKRLILEEMIARLYYRYYAHNGGVGEAELHNLKNMYRDDSLTQEKVDRLNLKVDKSLDHLYEIGEMRNQYMSGNRNKNCMSKSEFWLYTRLYMYIEKEYGKFSIPDLVEYYKIVEYTYQTKFRVSVGELDEFLSEASPHDKTKTRARNFESSLLEHKNDNKIQDMFSWFVSYLPLQDMIVAKDLNRGFKLSERKIGLAKQKWTCAIDGLPLSLDEAEADHMIPHALGGRTVVENMVMIRACHNREKGSMSFHDYKKLYDLRNKKKNSIAA